MTVPVELISPAVNKLPPVILPAALTMPPVVTLPADKFPVLAVPSVVAPVTLSVPPADISPAVTMLPPVTLPADMMLPLAETIPVTYSPVVANTATLLVPPMFIVALPPELTIVTLLVPLDMLPGFRVIPVSNEPLPMK